MNVAARRRKAAPHRKPEGTKGDGSRSPAKAAPGVAGNLDAVVVAKPRGEDVITLSGAELAYQSLFEQMSEGAVTLTADGVVAYCNQRFADIVRTPVARIVGGRLRRFVPRAEHPALEALLQTGRLQRTRGELAFQARDGGAVPVSVSFAPLQLDGTSHARGIIGVVGDITERKQVQESRNRLIHQVMAAQEEERRRVARELHDETGQSLTALLVGLRTMEGARTLAEAVALAQQLRKMAAQTLIDVGRLARGLHPSILDDMGLSAAVTHRAQEFAQLHRIAVRVRIEGRNTDRLPLLVKTTVYRVLQEALTNVAKHAHAGRVGVHLSCDATMVQLRVQDNGGGFKPSAAPAESASGERHRLGLQGMRERAALIGGSLQVESPRGKGAAITARFPLDGVAFPAPRRFRKRARREG